MTKLTLAEAEVRHPSLSFKRMKIHGKYRVIGRNVHGVIRVNAAWTWRKKRARAEKWLVTTLSYSCGNPPSHGSWHIDLTKVTRLGELTVQEQEKYCLKYLSKAFMKVLREGGDVNSRSWMLDLARFKEYKYTQEIIDSMTGGFVATEQGDGVEEEVLELWRCRG